MSNNAQPLDERTAVHCSYHQINRKIDNERWKYKAGDLIVMKEKIKLPDGSIEKHLRMYQNWARPFWVTKKAYRDYTDKREWIEKEKVQMYTSPHHALSLNVQKALGDYNPDPKKQTRMVARSPYVFGLDIAPNVLMLEGHRNKYQNPQVAPTEVAVLDIETDVLGAVEGANIVTTILLGKKVYCYALRSFIGKHTINFEREFYRIMDTDLPDIRGKYGYDVELVVLDTELDIYKHVFSQLHAWQPDIVTGWNVMEFDQKMIAKRLEELGEDPAEYFSDPRVPRPYKNYRYKEGRKYAISDSGKKITFKQMARWHEVIAPASFVWVDAMCVFYQLRKAKGMLPSYALDAILKDQIGRGKFEIPEAEQHHGFNKHIFMQRNYPIHYCVYNVFDVIGVDLLDKKTGDLRGSFLQMLGISSYGQYSSNPTKLTNSFFSFLYREKNMVLGSTSDTMFTEDDSHLPPLDGWIVALPTTMLDEIGYPVLKGMPEHKTKWTTHNWDMDIESSYPWTGIYCNISKITTEIEVCKIHGLSLEEYRRVGLNTMGGRVNLMSNMRIINRTADYQQIDKCFDMSYQDFLASKQNEVT